MEIYINNFNDSINKINDDIGRMNKFISNRGIQLNLSKSQSIIIESEKLISRVNNNIGQFHKVRVCDYEVEYSNSIKYLGFNFNSTQNSKSHVNEITKM